jgi:hypothetical protein
VSDKPHDDGHIDEKAMRTTTIHASKGGGAGKWLLGGVVALLLAGGGYLLWQNNKPSQPSAEQQTAMSDQPGAEAVHAGPLVPATNAAAQNPAAQNPAVQNSGSQSADSAASNEAAASTPASAASPSPASAHLRHAAARSRIPHEETVGLTPISANASSNDENVIVHGQRGPVWTSMPSARRLSQYYPDTALDENREGEASLHCMVRDSGALDCVRVSATPGGFGNAAMRLSHALRHAPQFADGSNAIGAPMNLHVVFRLPPDDERG